MAAAITAEDATSPAKAGGGRASPRLPDGEPVAGTQLPVVLANAGASSDDRRRNAGAGPVRFVHGDRTADQVGDPEHPLRV